MGWYMEEIPFIFWGIMKVLALFLIVRGIVFLAGFDISVPYLDPALQRIFSFIVNRLPGLSI